MYVAGIDIGTSSVKVMCIEPGGEAVTEREEYRIINGSQASLNASVWWEAVKQAFKRIGERLDSGRICAISLTSQVGTYILYNNERSENTFPVASWRQDGGKEQLKLLKSRFSTEYFKEHISMEHPDLVSYPAPRILWFQKVWQDEWNYTEKLLSPKDYLYYKLTGVFSSDPYTWRGLANLIDKSFHHGFLSELGISSQKLPQLYKPEEAPGKLLPGIAEKLGVKSDIPVFIGCNDFFASLLGMGVLEPGQCFDMTGTSEHIGVIGAETGGNTHLVSGPFFNGYIHYGVTASSGSSMDWGFRTFGKGIKRQIVIEEALKAAAPIFLPYMQGERAPVWDSNARGVFFGMESNHEARHLMYSIFEGVAFSLYHIWSGLSPQKKTDVKVGGGAAFDETLNQIKADLFQMPFKVMKEKDSAALGAAIFAGVGLGWFTDLQMGVNHWVKEDHTVEPDTKFVKLLGKRFDIYKNLYPLLKKQFDLWNIHKEVLNNEL